MPDDPRIAELQRQLAAHKSELYAHKVWRDNQQGDGNIRVENGKTTTGIFPPQFGVASVAGNTTPGGGGGGGGGGSTVTLTVIMNGLNTDYDFKVA